MPKITFSVDMKTGKSEMHIEGIAGAGCVPIHEQINSDLARALNLTPATTTDTDEMGAGASYTTGTTVRSGW